MTSARCRRGQTPLGPTCVQAHGGPTPAARGRDVMQLQTGGAHTQVR